MGFRKRKQQPQAFRERSAEQRRDKDERKREASAPDLGEASAPDLADVSAPDPNLADLGAEPEKETGAEAPAV